MLPLLFRWRESLYCNAQDSRCIPVTHLLSESRDNGCKINVEQCPLKDRNPQGSKQGLGSSSHSHQSGLSWNQPAKAPAASHLAPLLSQAAQEGTGEAVPHLPPSLPGSGASGLAARAEPGLVPPPGDSAGCCILAYIIRVCLGDGRGTSREVMAMSKSCSSL